MDDETLTADERWQCATSDYVDRVLELARAAPGHAGAQLRHATRELVLYGVGRPSAALASEMEQAPATIRVTWHEAPFSHDELTTEVQRVMAEHRGRITGGHALHDGTGLHFTTTDRELLEAGDPRSVLAARYPVTVEPGGPPVVA